MSILFVYWGRRGGIPRFVHELAQIIPNSHVPDIFYTLSAQNEVTHTPYEKTLRIQTYQNSLGALFSLLRLPFILWRLWRFCQKNKITRIVVFSNHLFGFALFPLGRLLGYHMTYLMHDAVCHPGESTLYESWLMRWQLRFCHTLLTLSAAVMDKARGLYACANQKHQLILFHPPFYYLKDEKKFKTHPEKILFIGRILPYKGLDLLLDAFENLNKTHDITLTIAGDGFLSETQLQRIQNLDVQLDQGWMDDTRFASIMASHDLVVLPYTEASQSGVIAAAYGLKVPVVVTPIGALPEQVEQLGAGWICEEVSSISLYKCLKFVIEEEVYFKKCSEMKSPDEWWYIFLERLCNESVL